MDGTAMLGGCDPSSSAILEGNANEGGESSAVGMDRGDLVECGGGEAILSSP